MREIVLDTETTGLDPRDGHRVIEIGCVELFDHIPTGNTYQAYLDPEREVPHESIRVHGITNEFLVGKPLFAEVVDAFLAFIGDAPLVIHNAAFDLKFINAELARVSREPIGYGRAIDTIEIAKRKLPGVRYSLDELCKRFNVDLSSRTKHGALLDSHLTAQIYLELVGGRQTNLLLAPADGARAAAGGDMRAQARPIALPSRLTPEEEAAHILFVTTELGPSPLWAME